MVGKTRSLLLSLLLGHITAIAAYCDTRSSMVGLSVSVCVCLLITFVSPAKTAELIKMPCGALSWFSLRGPPKRTWNDSVK